MKGHDLYYVFAMTPLCMKQSACGTGELARQAEMVHMDDVRLARAPSLGVRQGQPEPDGPGVIGLGTGSLHPGAARPSGHADLDVSLEYVAGCRRCHTSRLSLPVLPPFRLLN